MTTIRLSPTRQVGPNHPVYLVADIGANHDGSLTRARALIEMAAKAGADAVKFQHFKAATLASREGFAAIGRPELYEVYEKAETPLEWIPALAEDCKAAGVDFLSTPYDVEAADALEPYVHAYKVGSGDLPEHWFLECLAAKGKPIILSTGGAGFEDVARAMAVLEATVGGDYIEWGPIHLERGPTVIRIGESPTVVLMQCNLSYDGNPFDLGRVNLNVLRTYAEWFPRAVLGFSDHTPGHVAVLGAVALGAKVIEKHFTDDANRDGPDHHFATLPIDWANMVADVRRLEASLGDGIKRVEDNERDWRVIARRGNWDGRRLRPCPE